MNRMLRAFLRAEGRTLAIALVAVVAFAAAAGVLLADPTPGALAGATTTPTSASALDRAADADEDGLPDLDEIARWGTDPRSADSDADGLPDAWETRHARGAPDAACPDPTQADAHVDCAGKGLNATEDLRLGTDPGRADTDGDGIPDAYEATHGMDPQRADADADPFGDGLSNAQRFLVGARADRLDTACSGMPDAEKVRLGLDPSRASTGGSGVPDGWAQHFGLDPRDPGIGLLRMDGDPEGLSVLEKALASFRLRDLCADPARPRPDLASGLDPRKADSDEDGLPDAWEVRYRLDPADARDAGGITPAVAQLLSLPETHARLATTPPARAQDLDGDGLSNLEAYLLGACPDKLDCDGDGLSNQEEAIVGWDVTVDGTTRRVRSDPLRAISDGDRLPDKAKRDGAWTREGRTDRFPPLDPETPDTDGDGLPDAQEVIEHEGLLDPTRKDTDGDGLADGEEALYWDERARKDPERADRLCARCSVLAGRPANVANPDSDGDGLPDGDETRPRPHPASQSSPLRVPFPATDPAAEDTDGDGLPDGWEKRKARHDAALGAWDLDPARRDSLEGLPGASRGCAGGVSCPDGERDLDEDKLPNALELEAGADPHDADTDRDGLPDGWEWTNGLGGGVRHGPAPPPGRGFTWHPRAGDPVRLSPTDATDAARPLATYEYVRFSADAALQPGERLLRAADDTRAASIAGTRAWTMRDAYIWNASPVTAVGDGDGLPDLYKAFWSRAPLGREDALPLDAPVGALDPDGDGLPNAEEYRLGTGPLARDTDLGGLLDGAEREAGLDPRDPGDDSGEGDLDGDGLTNEHELRVGRTRVDVPDTDGDGLLDGGDVSLPSGIQATPAQASLRDLLLARGVLHHSDGDLLRFRGETSLDPDPACALRWSCANDGLPDAWKLHHGLSGGYHAPTESNSADGLGILDEYRWGRPANWSEETHGTWWLGLDPTRADTRRDGVSDRLLVAMEGQADLDGDGLHDLTGEDPAPFHAPLDVWDRGALLQARLARDATPAVGPVALQSATIKVDAGPPAGLVKGGSFELTGRVRSEDGRPPGRPVPVLARLVPADVEGSPLAWRAADPANVLGLAFTDAEGRFRLRVDVGKAHVATVPAGVHALFSAPASAGEIRWDAETPPLKPGASFRALVWSYGVPQDGHVLAGAAWLASSASRLASNATWMVPSETVIVPGQAATLNATLADGAGDPYAPARASLALLQVGNARLAPTLVRGANLTFDVSIRPDAPPAPIAARLVYEGDWTVGAGSADVTILPRLATRLSVRAATDRALVGDEVGLSGRLEDASGRPVAGEKVSLRLAGASAEATTRPDGAFDLRLPLPATAGLGAQTPTARYDGGRHHAPASGQGAAVTVLGQPEFTNLSATLALGKGGDVRGRLLAAGAPVVDPFTGAPPPVRVRVGSLEVDVTPDKAGSFRVPVPIALTATPASLRVELTSVGSALVLPASAAFDATVASPTALRLEPAQGTRGGAARVVGEVLDGADKPVAHAKVRATLGAAPVEAVADGEGRFALLLPIPDGAEGALRATVVFPGAAPAYAGTEATVEVRVLARVRVEMERSVVDAGDPVVRGRLLRDDGEPLAGLAFEASMDGGASRALVTRGDGTFSLPLTGAEASRATLALHLRAPARGGVGEISEKIALFIDRGARLAIGLDEADVSPGGRVMLQATLRNEQGLAIARAPLRVFLGGREVAAPSTDARGETTVPLSIPADAPLGRTVVEVLYAGAAGVRPAQASALLHVREAPRVEATLTAPERPGDAWQVALALRDSRGGALAGQPLFLRLADGGVLRAETDAEGRAVVILADASGGVTASFGGSDRHQPSSQAASVVATAPAPAEASRLGGALANLALAGLPALPLLAGFLLVRHRRRARRSLDAALALAERGFRAPDRHAQAALDAYRALVEALLSHRLLDVASATPREVQSSLRGAFDLPDGDLETVVRAFEHVRYAEGTLDREEGARVLASLSRLRASLKEAAR